jgi:hypothetical protein
MTSIDITRLGFADYRRAPARSPLTPLQQLLDHAASAAGRPVRLDELTLSTTDALELELRSKDFVWLVTGGGAPAERLWAMWMKTSRPFVSLKLQRGEALVES